MVTHYDHNTQDVSLLALDQYVHSVKWSVPMTHEEEALLVERVERGKVERLNVRPDGQVLEDARQARDRLVEGFQPIVLSIARKLVHRFKGMELLDVVQEGNLGVLHAIEKYDVGKAYPLRAMVFQCVRSAIWDAQIERDSLVPLGEHGRGVLSKVSRAQERLVEQYGREVSNKELADSLGISEQELLEWKQFRRRGYVESIQALAIRAGGEKGAVGEDHFDFVGLYQHASDEQVTGDVELGRAVQEALETVLTPRQREVVQLRYAFDGNVGPGRSQDLVAEMLGVRRESIRDVEMAAKRRLHPVLVSWFEEEEVA